MNQEKTTYHSSLASYFQSKPLYLDEPTRKKPNTRKLVEQPWQQTKGEMWDEVTNTLCNLDFIQAKAAAKMTYELVNDFNAAMEVIPDNAETIRQEKERQARMDKYTQDLIACAKGEIATDELEIPETITPLSEEQYNFEIQRLKTNPNRADRLKDFTNFLGQEATSLQNYAFEFLHFAIQQAWNFANDGIVGKAAEICSINIYGSLLLLSQATRPLWNPKPQINKILKGHSSCLTSVFINPGGKYAFASSDERKCILWDLTSGKAVYKLNGKSLGIIGKASITPDCKWAISGCLDNTCILFDLTTGVAIKTLKGHTENVWAVSITPDGKWAISGSDDKTCVLWDLTAGEAIKTLTGHNAKVNAVSITPDGKWAISGSDDKTCILWDLTMGVALKTLIGHTAKVSSVSITQDGKRAVSGSFDKTCIFWNPATGEVLKTLEGHTALVNAVSITPDGKRVISGSSDNKCILWNMTNGYVIQTLTGHNGSVIAVSITPDGKWAISGSCDQTGILWNLTTNEAFQTPRKHSSYVYSISITMGGKRALSCSFDKTCILWNLTTGEKLHTLTGTSSIKDISVTPDGNYAVSGSDDGTCILWDLNKGEAIKKLIGHTFCARSVSITPDGKRAVTGSYDTTCILWNLTTGKAIQTLKEHNDHINALAITPDGKRTFSGSSDNNCILWDLTSGKTIKIFTGHTNTVWAVSITPDSKMAISGSDDNTCILWNLITGKAIKTLNGHTAQIVTLAITPDGKRAISGSMDTNCILWNLTTGEEILTLKGHADWIQSISVTPDGNRAVSVSGMGKAPISGIGANTCIIWDLTTGKKLAIYITKTAIYSAALFPIGIVLGCYSGEVVILKSMKELLWPGPAITTIGKIWDFEIEQSMEFSADCSLCGHRFKPPQEIIQTILNILQDAGITPDKSPCLELPDEAWEHPGLIGECPECHEKLKFNPFFSSDMESIQGYQTTHERENLYLQRFNEAERAFKEENWDEAYNLYIKLVQQGMFDINNMRFKMAICKVNSLLYIDNEIITIINVLIKLLIDKGDINQSELVSAQLKMRMDRINQEESAKNKAAAPWWKRIF